MQAMMIYTTVASEQEAENIAENLLNAGLAACVNWGRGMTSMYSWQGTVEKSQEIPLIIKTRASLKENVFQRVKELHSYEIPCLLSFTAAGGDVAYLNWMQSVTLNSPS